MGMSFDIAALAANQNFWDDYLGSSQVRRESYWPLVEIRWALPGSFALQLEFGAGGASRLTFHSPTQPSFELGSRNQLGQTQVLRFDEVDLIGRWMALEDPDWPHPGPLLALLQPYTPITAGDQAEVAAGMFWQALESVRALSVQQMLAAIERSDWRGSDVRWQQTPDLGWTLASSHDVLRGRRLSTSRQAANVAFPFRELTACEAALRSGLAAAIDPAWIVRDGHVRGLAAASLDDLDPERWPILADALEECGCQEPGLLARFRPPVDPVRAMVMLEVLLAPLGVVPGQVLKGHLPPPPRRETERLEIWLPLDSRFTSADAEEFVELLRTELFREDQGSVFRESLQFNELRLRVILRGEMDLALQTVYRACRRSQAPSGTRIACDSAERHTTVFWPDWFA